MTATTGQIPSNITLSAGQIIRRNAGDDGFEATTPAGLGDVTGEGSSVDGNLVAFDGESGKAIKDSGIASAALGGGVPVGGIILWSGTIAAIPGNWALCDGNNGTPDLRDRFVVGAKQDDAGVAKTNLTGSLTQTGGAVSHHHADHSVTQPGTHAAHTHAYTEVPNHVHPQNVPSSASGGSILIGLDTNASGSTASGLSTANNTSGVSSGTTGDPSAALAHSGAAVDAHDTLSAPQPYYALAYIMRTA